MFLSIKYWGGAISLFLTLIQPITALNQQPRLINTYTTSDGLMNNTVSDIKQDVNGFYWLRSLDGFTRLDKKHAVKYNIHNIAIKPLDSCLKYYNLAFIVPNLPYNIFFIDSNSVLSKAIDSNLQKKGYPINGRFANINFNKIDTTYLVKTNTNKLNKITTERNGNYFYNATHIYYLNNLCFKKYNIENIECFFLRKDSLFLLTKLGLCFTLYKGNIINKDYSLTLKNLLSNTGILHTQYLEDKILCLISNKIFEFSFLKRKLLAKLLIAENDNKQIVSFFLDEKSKLLLIGTQKDGLYTYNNTRFTTYFNKIDGLSNNIFYSQTLSSDGLITNQDIYSRYLKQNYPVWQWLYTGPICQLQQHKILTTYDKTLVVLSSSLKPLKKIALPTYDFTTKINNSIIKTDSIVYLSNGALIKYSIESQKITTYPLLGWPTYGKSIETIALSPHPNCIYACIEGVLQELNIFTQKSTIIAKGFTGEVRDIYYDSSTQLIFISTRTDGCYCVLPNGTVTKLPAGTSGKFTTCHYVLQDKQGDYWLPTNNGLYCLFKKDLLAYVNKQIPNVTYKFWGKDDGIVNEEFNGGFTGSGIMIGDSISLCSMEGRVVFHPNIKYEVQKETGRLIIDAIQVDTTNLATSNTAITLSPSFRQLNIKVAYPFINNSSGVIEYRLLGTNDTAWHGVNENGIIDIKNLQAGKYTLGIKVGNSPTNAKTITIEVLPHWYNTWWMYSLYALLLAISLYVLFSWRLLQVKNKQLALLEKTKSQLFTTIAHDLKSPINNFTTLSDTMQFLIAEKDFDTIAAIGADMDKKSKKLTLLLSNILDWSLDEQAIQNNTTTIMNLQLLLATILPPYRDIAANKQVNIINQVGKQVSITTNEQALSTILRNLIDNAIKNAVPNSLLNIYAQQNTSSIYLQVSNTASDAAIPKLQAIKALLLQAKPIVPLADGVGLGLALVHSNVVKLGGNIKIGISDKTVTFYVELPSVG